MRTKGEPEMYANIPAIAKAAHDKGVPVLADTTWGTPYFFRSFERGVDVSIETCPHYLFFTEDDVERLGAARELLDHGLHVGVRLELGVRREEGLEVPHREPRVAALGVREAQQVVRVCVAVGLSAYPERLLAR